MDQRKVHSGRDRRSPIFKRIMVRRLQLSRVPALPGSGKLCSNLFEVSLSHATNCQILDELVSCAVPKA